MDNNEKKRIEDYINDYRVYPDEYTGKRDRAVLHKLGSNYKLDPETLIVTRLEGRINDNGDFEIVGLFKFPLCHPEQKTEITDYFEKTTALYFGYTLTKYNEMRS